MPMDRRLYPSDWDAIALQVKQAADWTCQECGRQCKRSDETWAEFISDGGLSGDVEGKLGRYILTVAHLNHHPDDCRPDNLKALCPVCHLRYDNQTQQRAIKRRLKRERNGQLRLDV